jgi:glycosyltransferase involved in cell wall biosynthesis
MPEANRPSVGIVVPTLNSGKTLEMTLLSLTSQKDVNLDVIVVDSGSTDNTIEICKKWNIKTMYAEPGNMYHAINIGLRKFNDLNWLGYINSDDWLYSDSLIRLISCANKSQAEVVYGNCDYADVVGRFVFSFASAKPEDLLFLFRLNILGFAQQSAIFKSSVYTKINGFDEAYYFCSDNDFYLRALLASFKFAALKGEPVACFRMHENQLSATRSQELAMEKAEMLKLIQNSSTTSVNSLFPYLRWRISNIPNYLIRLIRVFELTQGFNIINSRNTYKLKKKSSN